MADVFTAEFHSEEVGAELFFRHLAGTVLSAARGH
jgi:hypothetical protein